MVGQVPNEETPAQVRTEETTEAPKLVEESEEDSPAKRCRAARRHSAATGVRQQLAAVRCYDSSEHEGPDSGKLLFQFSL
jgi:hypothetical protein